MSQKDIYFVSDAHLGIDLPGYNQREKHLLSFLRSLRDKAQQLFIVGDLFDFWIEYRYAIRPDYFHALHELQLLREGGVEIHYMAGNHDFAIGSFLHSALGIHLHHDHLDTTLHGKRVHIYHGDGLLRDDVAYRVLRTVLRIPGFQRIYKWLHPNIGIPFASVFSGSSRRFLSHRMKAQRLAEYREHAKAFIDKGADIVIFGHTHHAEIVKWDDKIYLNTGEWLRRYHYATLRNGAMHLWEHIPGASAQEVPAIS
ncbi:MAG: hypothetical protein GF398_01290 [Chitinivibrionales bacterium]|nr:hypothetical protein [Chitinivibrionales bacterium]